MRFVVVCVMEGQPADVRGGLRQRFRFLCLSKYIKNITPLPIVGGKLKGSHMFLALDIISHLNHCP